MKAALTEVVTVTTETNPPEHKLNLLYSKLSTVRQLAAECQLCPRECNVDRLSGEFGICQVGATSQYSSVTLHHGEEPPISGTRGSGTIFFTGCNLRCKFCQNYPISQLRNGVSISISELSKQMLRLQAQGAHNINFVTPTPQAHLIFQALIEAYEGGLSIPLVYNSGGYESLRMIEAWDGIIDVYLPDAKYANDEYARLYSGAIDYTEHNRIALKEMFRQVGDLVVDDDGIAVRGLLIRHLVLPGGLAGSEDVFEFIAAELSTDTYISLMSQYFPAWKAVNVEYLNRRLTRKEYSSAVDALHACGLENGWVQPYLGIS